MATADKPARAMQCPQCGVWVLLGMVNGFKVAVDTLPLDDQGFRDELLAGRSAYVLVKGYVRMIVPGSPAWAPIMRKREHPCRAFAGVPIDAPQNAQKRPVCDLRRSAGWKPPSDCPRSRQTPAGEVMPVSCATCEPAPFAAAGAPEQTPAALFTEMLGAVVLSIEIGGRTVYHAKKGK